MNISVFRNPAIRRALYTLLDKYKDPDSYSIAVLSGDYIMKEIVSYGWYEKPFLSLLSTLIREPVEDFQKTCVIDVGANIGNHSLYFSRLVASVISVEPNPICVNLLRASLEVNDIKNVVVVPKGLGSSSGVETLSFNENHTGGGTLISQSDENSERRLVVDVDTLDNLVSELLQEDTVIRLLKIDAEEFEVNVILGGKKTLAKHSPIVAFEAHGIENYLAISRALKDEGYMSFYKLTQSRRMSRNFLLNCANMLFRHSMLGIEKVISPEDANYQMVIAVKDSELPKLDELHGRFKCS